MSLMTFQSKKKYNLKRDNPRALRKLKKLKFGDLVEISVVGNCSLVDIVTPEEAWKIAYDLDRGLLKTVGYFVGYDENFTILSADKIEEEGDRGQMNLILTKYIVDVVKIKD